MTPTPSAAPISNLFIKFTSDYASHHRRGLGRIGAEDVCFTVPSVAPNGGQVMSFDTVASERAIVAYFGLFPSLAPYIYVHANVVAQLNSGITAAEAAK
jgi:hypothetical protein